MKSVIASLVAAAGMSVAANAAVNTSFSLLVSTDGTTFSNNVNLNANTGIQTVQIIARVTYTGATSEFRTVTRFDIDPDTGDTLTTTHTESHEFRPLGLSSLLFQPTVSNFGGSSGADTMAALVNQGTGSNTSTPSGVVSNAAGQYGRIRPWGRTALGAYSGTTVATPGLVGYANTSGGQPSGNWLRIAQANATNWIGGQNNTSGGSGINIAQLASIGRNTSIDPGFVTTMTNVSIFRFAVNIDTTSGGAANPARILTVDAPLSGFGNLADPLDNNSDREVYWWAVDRTDFPTNPPSNLQNQITESTGSFRGTAAVTDGTITITPTPASLALLGLGGLVTARRRR